MKFVIALLLAVSSSAFAQDFNQRFPLHPDPELTPGKLCEQGKNRRYPEGIPYCVRNVNSGTKKERFQEYDRVLGFQTLQMDRQQFKIDHYIPLCMGGSNHESNLWPQHRTVYEITDPMEQVACEKMAQGLLKQAHAIELIRRGKNHLEEVNDIMNELESL
ncbi:MAG TPA: hypothetical protein VM432_03405 [Bdellovibrionales bacterium]|nr:hypothetical protein [Bdellovibrionales bacterium]